MSTVAHSGALNAASAPAPGKFLLTGTPRRSSLPTSHLRRLPSLKQLLVWTDRLCAAAQNPEDPATDVELVGAIAAGDRAALARIYRRYHAPFRAVASNLLDDPAEAEDLLHDVFLEAWQKARTFDAARGSVRSWLLVRLRSRAIDRLISPQRSRRSGLEACAADSASFASEDEPSANYLVTVVRREVSKLAASERRLLHLTYSCALTLPEVAAELGCPVGTIKSRLHRALRLLRKEEHRARCWFSAGFAPSP